MMQDVHVKLNPGLSGNSSNHQEEEFFHQQIELKLKTETSEKLH
jgi:hypothetical protein